MRHSCKNALGLLLIGMWLAMSAPVQAASANGPYYATPSWDQKLDANTRFIVLLNWNNQAVLDRETGLVWEQNPALTRLDWESAQTHCNRRTVGNRFGWRLPTIQELLSVFDPTDSSHPPLPPGHPFTGVGGDYWSATRAFSDPTGSAWVWFGSVTKVIMTLDFLGAWCVRGGQGVDPQ